jgi:hypothetical protein
MPGPDPGSRTLMYTFHRVVDGTLVKLIEIGAHRTDGGKLRLVEGEGRLREPVACNHDFEKKRSETETCVWRSGEFRCRKKERRGECEGSSD